MPSENLAQHTSAPHELYGTHQGLFYLLGVNPILPGGQHRARQTSCPASGLIPAQAALARAALADMFQFKGN